MGKNRVVYIATIEGIGIGTSATQCKFCYPEVPSFGDATYVATLAEPPSGSISSIWKPEDGSCTVGSFRLQFLRLATEPGPFRFQLTAPSPITELTAANDSLTTTTFTHAKTNTQAGISVNDILYCGRETLKVTTASGGSTSLVAARAQSGSTANYHLAGVDIFTVPPTLLGRAVTVYKKLYDDTGAEAVGDVILRGFINSEVSSIGGGSKITFQVAERFGAGLLNDYPVSIPDSIISLTDGIMSVGSSTPDIYGGAVGDVPYTFKPIGSSSGSYFYSPDASVIFASEYNSTTGKHEASTLDDLIRGDANREYQEDVTLYPILYADKDGPYPPFGHYNKGGGSFVASSSPCVIALNILLSSVSGTVEDSDDRFRYDLGSFITQLAGFKAYTAGGLYPAFALSIPRAQVDVRSFEDAWDILGDDIQARDLFLGGTQTESITELFKRMFSPLGFAVGQSRDGVWRLLRVESHYPKDTATALTDSGDLQRPQTWQLQSKGRAISEITIEVDPDPTGTINPSTLSFPEVEIRDWYPPHTGTEQGFSNSPYRSTDIADMDSVFARFVCTRVRIFAQRTNYFKGEVGSGKAFTLDVGDKVTLDSAALIDPSTGDRVADGTTLQGLITAVSPTWGPRDVNAKFTALISPDIKTAHYSPSAKVTGYTGGTKSVAVSANEFSNSYDSNDPAHFSALDKVWLIDSHGVKRSSGSVAVASIPDSTHIILADAFDVTPAAGNYLVFSDHDDCVASQRADYGYVSDGGVAASGTPGLGSSDVTPYKWGE